MSNSEVVWNIVKKSSSFLHKNNDITLTCEPYNVLNVNARKFSGLCNKKAVGITVVDGKVVMSKKLTKMARYPSKQKTSMVLNQGQVNHENKSAACLRKNLMTSHYRVGLVKYAIARCNKLNKSLKSSKDGKKGVSQVVPMQISKAD